MKTKERWLPIKGKEGYYEVSNAGRVRSLTRTINTSHGQQRTYQGKVKKLSERDGGRLVVNLQTNGIGDVRIVSQVVAETFIGPRPKNKEVCHNNGDPKDNRVENLRYDTHSENMHDKKLHGTDHNVNKKQCLRGHSLSGDNLIPSKLKKGVRACRACNLTDSLIRKHPELEEHRQKLSDSYFKKWSARID